MHFLGNVAALEWPLPSRSSAPNSFSAMRRYRHFLLYTVAQVSGTGSNFVHCHVWLAPDKYSKLMQMQTLYNRARGLLEMNCAIMEDRSHEPDNCCHAIGA